MKLLTGTLKSLGLKILAVGIAYLLIPGDSCAQQFSFPNDRRKETIDFLLIKNLIIVPLYINEKGPFNFILDTGVGPLIISDPALADSLKLKNLRTIKIAGLGKGEEIEAYVTSDMKVRLGRATIEGISSAILKEDIFRLSNYLGIEIHGLLGYHFFKSFIVEIKYSTSRLSYSVPWYPRKIKGEKIPIELINDKPYADVTITTPELGEIPAKVLIDNGASHAISLEILNGKPFPASEGAIPANLGMGLGGPISGRIGRIPTLKIGNYTLKNVLTSFPEYDEVAGKILLKDRNGNLGADVLSRFNIVFDYGNNVMYIKKNSNFGRPFEHDMAGMEVYADGDKIERFFIARIEPNSPAELCGLEAGDEIVYINFTPASGYKLADVNRILKSGDGRSVIITVVRAGQLYIKLLKLKQRV